jgi:hypothetical protein
MTCRGCHQQVCTCPDPIYAGLAGGLVDQSARDSDAHGTRGEVKGAAVHEGIDTHAA